MRKISPNGMIKKSKKKKSNQNQSQKFDDKSILIMNDKIREMKRNDMECKNKEVR